MQSLIQFCILYVLLGARRHCISDLSRADGWIEVVTGDVKFLAYRRAAKSSGAMSRHRELVFTVLFNHSLGLCSRLRDPFRVLRAARVKCDF